MPENKFYLPTSRQRVSVIGRTGSGKTHLSMWLLSHANFHSQPWIIIDFKREDFFQELRDSHYKSIEDLYLDSPIPRKPGLYRVQPEPDEHDELQEFLYKIWRKRKTGVFTDEAHMMPPRGAFPTLLTQGRSLQIPMITVTQKPAWISKFVFSEADYFAIFHLTDEVDRKRVMQFVPANLDVPLPEHHSYWHDVNRYRTFPLKPVPDRDTILQRFHSRLGEQKSWSGFISHGQSKIGSRWF